MPDPAPESVFVITAYTVEAKALEVYKRRRARKPRTLVSRPPPPARASRIAWEAAKQIEEANKWWRDDREGSPDALAEDLARAFDLLSRQPGIGAPARSVRLPDVRRLLLPRA